jgi:hypothetical protein
MSNSPVLQFAGWRWANAHAIDSRPIWVATTNFPTAALPTRPSTRSLSTPARSSASPFKTPTRATGGFTLFFQIEDCSGTSISAGDGKIVGYFEHPTEISSYLYWYPEDVRDRTLVSEQGFNALGIARASTARAWITSRSRSWPAIRLDGGGFVVLNGMTFDEDGTIRELDTPFPGCNLFSLASGGAIYVRDPRQRVGDDQLNGGMFVPLTAADWAVVPPYLKENASMVWNPDRALVGRRWPPCASRGGLSEGCSRRTSCACARGRLWVRSH